MTKRQDEPIDQCDDVADDKHEEAIVSLGDDGFKIERVTEPFTEEAVAVEAKRLYSLWLRQEVEVVGEVGEKHLRVRDQDGREHTHPRKAFSNA